MVSFEHVEEIRTEDRPVEWQRFQKALQQSIDEVERLKSRMSERMPDLDASLFDTHR